MTPKPVTPVTNDGIRRIADERARQVNRLGWTPEHDTHEHQNGDLALVAAYYTLATIDYPDPPLVTEFPWSNDARPDGREPTFSERVRLLEKAGALIAAELDRLLDTRPTSYIAERQDEQNPEGAGDAERLLLRVIADGYHGMALGTVEQIEDWKKKHDERSGG